MTGESDDARPPTNEPNAVDAAWDELIEETGKDEEDSGPTGVAAASPLGREERPAFTDSGAHPVAVPDAMSGDLLLRADDVMARLMAGEAPQLPKVEAAGEPDAAAKPDADAATAKPDAAAKSDADAATAKPDATAKPEPDATAKSESNEHISRPSLQVVAGGDQRTDRPADDRPAPVAAAKETPKVDDSPPARASRPMEPSPAPATPAPRGLPWAWIGVGAITLGAAAYLTTPEDSSSESRPQAESPIAVAPEPLPSPEPMTPEPDSNDGAGSEGGNSTGPGNDGAEDPPETTPKALTGDPREPPPGTSPEIAAAFRRLPVSPYDRPPVGGIGAGGIHIDHIAMGSETRGATCSGKSDDFSVDARERPAVCVRVVHLREKEELQVLWEKHDGSTRRSKMVVLPMHAYRTRGYLVLRSEYIGDWTVRILSPDGVELAHHDFTVVP